MPIPYIITKEQAEIAEMYWGKSWTGLSSSQVQIALNWWYCYMSGGYDCEDCNAEKGV